MHDAMGARSVPVLIVDDDQILAELLSLTMARAGFEPLIAVDADAARALFDRRGDIAAIICDYELGGIDGVTVLSEIAVVAPHVRRVLISGLSLGTIPADCAPGTVFFQKPFRVAELIAAIQTPIPA